MILEVPKYRHPDVDFQQKQYMIHENFSTVDGIGISKSVLAPKKWNYKHWRISGNIPPLFTHAKN